MWDCGWKSENCTTHSPKYVSHVIGIKNHTTTEEKLQKSAAGLLLLSCCGYVHMLGSTVVRSTFLTYKTNYLVIEVGVLQKQELENVSLQVNRGMTDEPSQDPEHRPITNQKLILGTSDQSRLTKCKAANHILPNSKQPITFHQIQNNHS